jgi:hypothetical protein
MTKNKHGKISSVKKRAEAEYRPSSIPPATGSTKLTAMSS